MKYFKCPLHLVSPKRCHLQKMCLPSLLTSNLHWEISERNEKPSRIKTGVITS